MHERRRQTFPCSLAHRSIEAFADNKFVTIKEFAAVGFPLGPIGLQARIELAEHGIFAAINAAVREAVWKLPNGAIGPDRRIALGVPLANNSDGVHSSSHAIRITVLPMVRPASTFSWAAAMLGRSNTRPTG